eukprot:2935233-Rhodomonas_salina.1
MRGLWRRVFAAGSARKGHHGGCKPRYPFSRRLAAYQLPRPCPVLTCVSAYELARPCPVLTYVSAYELPRPYPVLTYVSAYELARPCP